MSFEDHHGHIPGVLVVFYAVARPPLESVAVLILGMVCMIVPLLAQMLSDHVVRRSRERARAEMIQQSSGIYRARWTRVTSGGIEGWNLSFTPPLCIPPHAKIDVTPSLPPPFGPEEFNVEIRCSPIE